jgi:hypothetical protein
VIYLDSSVALTHLLAEDRFPAVDLWRQQLVSSRLLEYEVWNRIYAPKYWTLSKSMKLHSLVLIEHRSSTFHPRSSARHSEPWISTICRVRLARNPSGWPKADTPNPKRLTCLNNHSGARVVSASCRQAHVGSANVGGNSDSTLQIEVSEKVSFTRSHAKSATIPGSIPRDVFAQQPIRSLGGNDRAGFVTVKISATVFVIVIPWGPPTSGSDAANTKPSIKGRTGDRVPIENSHGTKPVPKKYR